MDTHKLKIFLNLLETGNCSETAEQLFTTQSTVSKQIQSLEKELEIRLFDSSRRSLVHTPAAEQIREDAKKIIETEEHMKHQVRELADDRSRELRICAIPVLSQYKVSGIFRDFQKAFPDVSIRMTETENKLLEEQLKSHSCDLIFTRLLDDEDTSLDIITMDTDALAAILPCSHPLSQRSEIGIEELKEESFLLLDEKTGLLNCVKNLCRESGFSPKITYKGVRIDTILDMIANDLGVSILMNHSVDCSRQPGIVKIPLKKTCTSRLIFARNHNSHYRPEEKNFWNYLTQRFIRESNTSLENQN